MPSTGGSRERRRHEPVDVALKDVLSRNNQQNRRLLRVHRDYINETISILMADGDYSDVMMTMDASQLP
jgi:hypothetical protein